MTGPAIRSRVLELQRSLAAARHGRTLLDQKREALQRELTARLATRAAALARAVDATAAARALLDEARMEVGQPGLLAAASAQPTHLQVARSERSLVGVVLPDLVMRKRDFRLQYTLSDTAPSVDRAAVAFANALEIVIGYAKEESAARQLRAGLGRTTRRLNALDLLVIPGIRRELHDVTAALEEEERDERLRVKRWLLHRSEPATRNECPVSGSTPS